MRPRGSWLCLGLLFFSVHAELEEEDAEVVEDFEDSSEETHVKEGKLPPEIKYKTPQPVGEVYFTETFDNGRLAGEEIEAGWLLLSVEEELVKCRWVLSKAKKDDADDELSIYDGRWEIEELRENHVPGDRGLVLKSRAKHHAIAAILAKPFIFADKPLIVQYEVNFQDGIDCGGAYIKLLADTDGLNLENFHDKTPYTIMFGPDKCGEEYKFHFIFRHKHPKTGAFEEKHAMPPDVNLRKFFTDRKTHLYTLVLNPDDTFEMLIDQIVVNKGNLLEHVVPPINPPKEIEDPNDQKPDDWDERAKIPDPSAVKPEDWDESEPAQIEDPSVTKPEGWLDNEPMLIPDPQAEKPADWNEDMDGEWEAPRISNPACQVGCGEWQPPMIDNPKYKGIWKPPMIDNPSYQGVWSPRKIPNPDYFEDDHPFLLTSFCALGLELWSMTSDIYFDNFIICSEKEVADRWAADGWGVKIKLENANEPGVFKQLLETAKERPWLWIIYFVSVGLPIILLISFCWPRKGKKKCEENEYKKVDNGKPQTKGALEQDVKAEKAALERLADPEMPTDPERPADPEEEKKQSNGPEEEKKQSDGPEEDKKQSDGPEEDKRQSDGPEEDENQSDGPIEERKQSGGELPEKEEEGEPEEKSEEEIEIIDGQEEGNKSSKSGSEDEMKDNESTGSGDGPVKTLRKRRVRKE